MIVVISISGAGTAAVGGRASILPTLSRRRAAAGIMPWTAVSVAVVPPLRHWAAAAAAAVILSRGEAALAALGNRGSSPWAPAIITTP